MTRRELLSHPVAIIGVLMTTASAVVFIALVIAMLAGMLVNPYAGLVVFIAIPALFVAGLLLVPVGARLQRRKLARDPQAVIDYPVLDFRRASVRRTAVIITALTAVNVVIILLAGYGSLHWMESPTFCGQVCHTPMQPQHTAWRSSHTRKSSASNATSARAPGRLRSRQALRIAAARACRDPFLTECPFRQARRWPRGTGEDVRQLPPAPGAEPATACA
jgi:hypothetical protein